MGIQFGGVLTNEQQFIFILVTFMRPKIIEDKLLKL